MMVLLVANVFILISLVLWSSPGYLNVVQGSLVCFFSILLLYSPCIGSVVSEVFFYDSLSGVMVFLVCFVSFLILLVYIVSSNDHGLLSDFFSIVVYFLNTVLLIAFLVSNMVWFYVFFEASLVPVLILILGWGYQPERLQAGIYMIIYTICGSLPFLYMVVSLCFGGGQFCFLSIGCPNIGVWIGWLLLMGVFLVKLPIFSVHLWLPKAHVEAPLVGSIVLAGILLKLGGYGLMRFFKVFGYDGSLGVLVFVVGLYGGGILTLLCLRQLDIKSLIAYSSVCHISVVLGGILSNSEVGWSAAIVGMLSHGFCSSGLFVLANMCYESVGSRSLLLMGGFFNVSPSLTFFLFMFSVVNSGVPPFVNFVGEVLMGMSIFYSSVLFLFSLSILFFFSFAYNMYIYTSVAHGKGPHVITGSAFSIYYLVLFLHLVPLCMVFWSPAIFYGF